VPVQWMDVIVICISTDTSQDLATLQARLPQAANRAFGTKSMESPQGEYAACPHYKECYSMTDLGETLDAQSRI